MWAVDKRYLNDGMFQLKDDVDQPIAKTQADNEILRDRGMDYRVVNMTTNTFNENNTSYYHKSIGGYHAAKLRRYNELIEHYIAPEMQNMNKTLAPQNLSEGSDKMLEVTDKNNNMPVLNMLNTKYLIVSPQGQQPIAVRNKSAMGNAWFVNKVDYVDNANEEMDGINWIEDVVGKFLILLRLLRIIGQAVDCSRPDYPLWLYCNVKRIV